MGIPAAWRTFGFIWVTSWCSKSGLDSVRMGTSCLNAVSNASADAPGTPYHVFGSPRWTKLIDALQWSSVCYTFQERKKMKDQKVSREESKSSKRLTQQKALKTIPTYIHGTFMPEIWTVMCLRMDSSLSGNLFKFHGWSIYSRSDSRRTLRSVSVGNPLLPCSPRCRSAPYSTTVSSLESASRRQNSDSTTWRPTLEAPKKLRLNSWAFRWNSSSVYSLLVCSKPNVWHARNPSYVWKKNTMHKFLCRPEMVGKKASQNKVNQSINQSIERH